MPYNAPYTPDLTSVIKDIFGNVFYANNIGDTTGAALIVADGKKKKKKYGLDRI